MSEKSPAFSMREIFNGSVEFVKPETFTCSVSSTLQNNVYQYGKAFMFDNNPNTCWASNPSKPQWIAFQFKDMIQPSHIGFEFQGGFSGKECEVKAVYDDDKEDTTTLPILLDETKMKMYKLDINRPCKRLIIKFNSSSDPFGRIIIYKLVMFKVIR